MKFARLTAQEYKLITMVTFAGIIVGLHYLGYGFIAFG